jgi:hypothetical protein
MESLCRIGMVLNSVVAKQRGNSWLIEIMHNAELTSAPTEK